MGMADAIKEAQGGSELGTEAAEGEGGSFAVFGAHGLAGELAGRMGSPDAALTELGRDALTIAGRGAEAVADQVAEFKTSDPEGRWWLWRQMADEAGSEPAADAAEPESAASDGVKLVGEMIDTILG